MYSAHSSLGDWKSTLKSVRDAVHSIFPRELSPSRMLEKYASDAKKKNAAKLAKVATASTTKNVAADAALKKKLDALTAVVPPQASIPGGAALVATQPKASAPATDEDSLTIALAIGAGALLLFFVATRK